MTGFLITFEGGEGVGKTTQIQELKRYLVRKKYNVLTAREPGGTQGGEVIRALLLQGIAEKYGPQVEAYLIAAARLAHVENVLAPALKTGHIVLCDRFIDSTRVYQGSHPRMNLNWLLQLEKISIQGVWPHLTFLLDMPVSESMTRAVRRRGGALPADRFERETLAIHKQRREAFLALAAQDHCGRFQIINADQPVALIAQEIAKKCDYFLTQYNQAKS